MGSGRLCCRSRGWGLRVVSTQNSKRGTELGCLRGLEGPKFQRRGVLGAAQLSAPCPQFSVLLGGAAVAGMLPVPLHQLLWGPPMGDPAGEGCFFGWGEGFLLPFRWFKLHHMQCSDVETAASGFA